MFGCRTVPVRSWRKYRRKARSTAVKTVPGPGLVAAPGRTGLPGPLAKGSNRLPTDEVTETRSWFQTLHS